MSWANADDAKLDGTPVNEFCDWCERSFDTCLLGGVKVGYIFHPDTGNQWEFTRTYAICPECKDDHFQLPVGRFGGSAPGDEERGCLPEPYACDWCKRQVTRLILARLKTNYILHPGTRKQLEYTETYWVCPPCEGDRLDPSEYAYYGVL